MKAFSHSVFWTTSVLVVMSATSWGEPANVHQPHPGWDSYNTPHLTFYYAPDSSLAQPGAIDKYAMERESALHAIYAFLGIRPKDRIYMYVYDTAEQGRKITGSNVGWASGRQRIIRALVRQSPGHEICHIALVDVRAAGKGVRSKVITEGFPTLMNCRGGNYILPGQKLLEEGRLPSLGELDGLTGKDTRFSAAPSFVAFLIDKYGKDRFTTVCRLGGPNLEEILRKVYGCSMKEMENGWRNYLSEYVDPAKQPAPANSELMGTGGKNMVTGTWNINYSHGGKRTYVFEGPGKVTEKRGRPGQVTHDRGLVLIDFGDNKLDTWEATGDPFVCLVVHYFPKTNYPEKWPACAGIARRQP